MTATRGGNNFNEKERKVMPKNVSYVTKKELKQVLIVLQKEIQTLKKGVKQMKKDHEEKEKMKGKKKKK